MKDGFYRIAAVAPTVSVADPDANSESIISTFGQLASAHVDLAVYPELSVSAYTCADLFHNSLLYDRTIASLERMTDE